MKPKNLQIWKYEIPFPDGSVIEIPYPCEVVALQVQNDRPCIWVSVDPNGTKYKRCFKWVGTGHTYPADWIYVGTLQGGLFIWHLFTHAPES